LRRTRRAYERHLSYKNFLQATGEQDHTSIEEKIVDAIALKEALAQLTPLQRRRLEAYEAGYTLREIADREGVTIMPVFRSIRKAESKIKNYLKKSQEGG
jgi:RNA polymerase sigma factor (sigma-70 family)